jgi:hypothetical protein
VEIGTDTIDSYKSNYHTPHFREIDEPFIRSQLGDVSLTLFILIKEE